MALATPDLIAVGDTRKRQPGLYQCGIENDLPQRFVLCHEAMGSRRFLQGHDAVYENFELSRLSQLQGALEIFLTLGSQPAFHLQTLLVEAPDVESDQPAAV